MSGVLTQGRRPFRVRADSGEGRSGARLGDLVWLTWRQHRWTITGSVVLAAGITGWMSYLAVHIAAINRQCGDTVCADSTPQFADLHANLGPLQMGGLLGDLVLFLPLLIGVFLGVPLLAREHEQRTLLLAWSQDVTPARWLWTKFVLLGALAAALAACVSAAAERLADAMNVAMNGSLFEGNAFLMTGMLPLVLGVAWFAVGVAVGAAVRRVLPAVLAALGGFVGLYLLVHWRYPTLMTPVTTAIPLGGGGGLIAPLPDPNALIISGLYIGPQTTNLVDASGHAVSSMALRTMCPVGPAADDGHASFPACLAQHHVSALMTYQPGSRITDFHLILIGGYAVIGVVALAATWWLLRRTSLSAG